MAEQCHKRHEPEVAQRYFHLVCYYCEKYRVYTVRHARDQRPDLMQIRAVAMKLGPPATERFQVYENLLLRRFTEAVRISDALVSTQPHSVDDNLLRGRAYYRLDQALRKDGKHIEAKRALVTAIASFRKAADLAPADYRVLSMLAWTLATAAHREQRNPQEAVQLAKNARERQQGSGSVRETQTVAFYRLGQWEQAKQILDEWTEKQRKDGSTYYWPGSFFRAMANWQLGDHELAKAQYSQIVAALEKDYGDDDEFLRFRAEAEELMHIKRAPAALPTVNIPRPPEP